VLPAVTGAPYARAREGDVDAEARAAWKGLFESDRCHVSRALRGARPRRHLGPDGEMVTYVPTRARARAHA
jgi:hypothetical protein